MDEIKKNRNHKIKIESYLSDMEVEVQPDQFAVLCEHMATWHALMFYRENKSKEQPVSHILDRIA